MKIIDFPGKENKCNCDSPYVYRKAYHPVDKKHAVMIGKRLENDEIVELTVLQPFDNETEATNAALVFMDALEFVRQGGEF